MMPENGGIGVFAHEYGHNLGADDLYAYDQGETSAGFWTLMADDWTGYPIGFEPPAVDPWHLDNWGWLDPVVITDPDQVYEVILGQASRFPGGEDMYRGVKIVLPEGVLDQPVPVWQGDYYWWGGKENLANAMMTTVDPIAIPAGGATLSFDLVYDIEDEWDFLWIQVSTVPSPEPSGVDWDTLTNENTQCEHDPSWIGGYYGFPVDLCGAGIGGFYGYNENWPDPEVQEFDLSAYAGQSIYLRFWYMTDWASLYSGAFVDNVKVTADTTVLPRQTPPSCSRMTPKLATPGGTTRIPGSAATARRPSPTTSTCSGATWVRMAATTGPWVSRAGASARPTPTCWCGTTTTSTPTTKSGITCSTTPASGPRDACWWWTRTPTRTVIRGR